MIRVGPRIFLYMVFLLDFFTAGANLYSEPNAAIEIEEKERKRKRNKKKKEYQKYICIAVHSDNTVLAYVGG
jgi:hypothetical protein